MDEQTEKGNQYTYDGLRQTRAINIPMMDEQTDKVNQYVGLADRKGQSKYLQWKNIPTRQSIYLRWTNRQTRKIIIVTMDEQTDKGNQYTYDERIDRQGQSIYRYLRWTNRQTMAFNIPTKDEQTDKGNQYAYDGRTDRQG